MHHELFVFVQLLARRPFTIDPYQIRLPYGVTWSSKFPCAFQQTAKDQGWNAALSISTKFEQPTIASFFQYAFPVVVFIMFCDL